MKHAIRIILYPLTALFYWLGGFVPRGKNRWIFGSYTNAFNDNSKYLFIHVVENHPEIEAIWITGDPKVINHIRAAGGKAISRWSMSGIIACLTGRYWFVSAYLNDINYYCSRNATIINLWHGIPLKKIEFDIENGPLAKRFQNPNFIDRHIIWPQLFRRPEYVISTSAHVSAKSFASAFRIEQDQCLNVGYPRTDAFFQSYSERLRIATRWGLPDPKNLINKISSYSRCLIYMPTWRDANPNFIIQSGWDFPKINEALKELDTLLLLKLHVATPQSVLKQAIGLSQIHLIESTEDAYSILPLTSGLITDYSSIQFDYLLLDRPIYYYSFDQKEYESDCRGFYHTYDSCTAGRRIESPMELITALLADDDYAYATIRGALRKRFFDNADPFSSERIVQNIKSL